MKNLFLAAAAALGLLVSCNKEDNEIYETSKGAVATVSFTDEEPATRAFFGSTAAAETWEKALNTVTIFVIDPSGDLLAKRSFSAAELSAKKATFALPNAVPGTVCEFYAVANLDMAQVNSSDVLTAMLEQDAASYNGTFAEVSAKAKRTGGFVMSGSASKAVAAAGSSTDVAITLKRTVAKVAVQVTPSPQFGSLTPLDHIFSLLRILDADKARGCEFHSSFSLCLNAFNALQSGQFPPLLVCIE